MVMADRKILVSLVFAAVILASGCSLLDKGPSWPGGESPDPKAGTHSETFSALWTVGLLATVAGIAVFAIRVAGIALLPGGTGLITAASGAGVMFATDILAANPWIVWLLLTGLLTFGLVEWFGGAAIKRKIGKWIRDIQELA